MLRKRTEDCQNSRIWGGECHARSVPSIALSCNCQLAWLQAVPWIYLVSTQWPREFGLLPRGDYCVKWIGSLAAVCPLLSEKDPQDIKRRNGRKLISLATVPLYCSHHYTQSLRIRAQSFQFWKIQAGVVISSPPQKTKQNTYLCWAEINFSLTTTTHVE